MNNQLISKYNMETIKPDINTEEGLRLRMNSGELILFDIDLALS